MDFDRLDKKLKEKHMSRRALALAVGIKESTMSTAFMRRSGLSYDDAVRIGQFLGISPFYLEGWTDDENGTALAYDQLRKANIVMSPEVRKDPYYDERQRLNTAFNKLNTGGQAEAVKRVEELTEIPRYTAPDPDREA